MSGGNVLGDDRAGRRIGAAERQPDSEQADHDQPEAAGQRECNQKRNEYDHFGDEYRFAAEAVGKSAEEERADENAEQGRGANNAVRRWPDFEFVKEQRKSDAGHEKNEAGEEFARCSQRPDPPLHPGHRRRTEQSSVDPHRQFVDVVLHRLRARLGGQQSLHIEHGTSFPRRRTVIKQFSRLRDRQ